LVGRYHGSAPPAKKKPTRQEQIDNIKKIINGDKQSAPPAKKQETVAPVVKELVPSAKEIQDDRQELSRLQTEYNAMCYPNPQASEEERAVHIAARDEKASRIDALTCKLRNNPEPCSHCGRPGIGGGWCVRCQKYGGPE